MSLKARKEQDLSALQIKGDDLKCDIWAFLDNYEGEHKGLKEAVNEMLDLIDELKEQPPPQGEKL